MNFYLDNDVPVGVKDQLQGLGHGALTTRDLGRWRANDARQVLLAAERGWTLVTHNAADFVLLHEAWRLWTATWNTTARHSGILIIPQHRWSPIQAAQHIHQVVANETTLLNALYRWWPNSGWLQHLSE